MHMTNPGAHEHGFSTTDGPSDRARWDHGSDERFFRYYEEKSTSPGTLERFLAVKDVILRILAQRGRGGPLEVRDIGCGAGTQAQLWAESGHYVRGIDVNGPLIELARERARERKLGISFDVGSATELPWPDASCDVCLVPELLEHVVEWRVCLREFARILRPEGILFLSTTNKLCPVQQEFELPLYSWYPARLKRHYERLSLTTRPELVNYAKYPAVNWFTFFGLRREMADLGLAAMDRFDILSHKELGLVKHAVVWTIRRIPPARWLAHVATPYTSIIAIKPAHTMSE